MELKYPRHNPRDHLLKAIHDQDVHQCLIRTAEIHGHYCPGSALCVMASVYGLNLLGNNSDIPSDGLENLMAIVEINACFADGVQVVSGCTLGNNALVYRDLGRHAVTFAVRGNDTAVRVRVQADFRSCIHRLVPEFYPLMEKVIKNRAGSRTEEAVFKEKAQEAAFGLIKLPFEEILAVKNVRPELPDYAPIVKSAICPACGEPIMATKTVSEGENRGLCLICSGGKYYQVEGQGIVAKRKNGEI